MRRIRIPKGTRRPRVPWQEILPLDPRDRQVVRVKSGLVKTTRRV